MQENEELLGTGRVAEILGLSRWRLIYLLEKGVLPETSHWISGRRLFTREDLEKLQAAISSSEMPHESTAS